MTDTHDRENLAEGEPAQALFVHERAEHDAPSRLPAPLQRAIERADPRAVFARLRGVDWRAAAKRFLIDERGLVALPLWLVAGYIVYFALLLSWPYPPYPPDSWSYYELSRSFPQDPMHLRIFRSFITTEPYSASFPPLWPFSIAIVDMIGGFGVNSGQLAGGLYLGGTAICIDLAGFRWFRRRGLGPAALLVLLIYTPMIQEVASSAAIAPTLFFTSAIILVLANPWPLTDAMLVRLGLLSGCLALTRFDTLMFVGLLPLVLLALRAMRRSQAVRSYVALAIGLSPWILYSLVRFGTPWASDNGRTALATQSTFVLDYLPDGVPTLLDQPGEWFTRVRGLYGITLSTTWAAIDEARLPMILAGLLLVVVVVSVGSTYVAGRADGGTWKDALGSTLGGVVRHRSTRVVLAVAALQFATVSFALSTTGYIQSRYLTVTVFLVELALLALILAVPRHVRVLAPVATCAALLWLGSIRYGSFSAPAPLIEGFPFTPVVISPYDAFRDIALCITPTDRPMFTQQAGVAYMLGALSDAGGVVEPTNFQRLTAEQRLRFLKEFKVTHLYITPTLTPEAADRQVTVDHYLLATGLPTSASTEVCTPGLYQLDLEGR